ncbi:arylsulfatase [Sporocytophaga myxococcoides]|uniref:arylsulfatase n=1 Tax=Sporocytophaga myxococcoides TaxID=153721 RepID=UPI000422D0D0|nr:arylsulfatase [Sporocytophaga myxococcoides]
MKKSLFTFLLISFGISAIAQKHSVQPYKGKVGKTLSETQQSWPEKVKAPKGSPNIVWILLDDIGFGAISAFGGLIETPTLDSLANNGLRYTNFHTTAICAPTRAALLTGRNHHSVHMGLFPDNAIGTPGYDAVIPFEKGFISEILRENGYNTYALGKWHITPIADLTPAGPFNRWPTGRGFDHFYGYPYRGSSDQYHSQLWEDTRRLNQDNNGKHFNTLLADKAIAYVSEQKSIDPEKPFFLYFATGAGHAPHQVDKYWSDKYKGKFDKGWDKYREEVLARQIKAGIVPKNTVLPDRNPGIKKWDSLSVAERKLYTKFMEVYAGFLTQTDYEIGRVIRHLKEIGQLDNTLIAVSVGDNGASKEGTFVGFVNSYDPSWTEEQILQQNIKDQDLIGTEFSKANYPLGWAAATNVPFRQWKTDANTEGGTRNPLILFYPEKIKDKGGIRSQYSHINDILPTTIELAGLKIPESIDGIKQDPIEGISLAYSINDPKAPSRKTQQYYEVLGTRSIYKDGWKAGVLHKRGEDFSKDVWELYNLNEDFNERFNLAKKNPEKLKELQALFDSEAAKYNIYPLKDGTGPIPTVGPGLFDGKERVILYPGLSTIVELPAPKIAGRSFSVIADIDVPAQGSEGVLFSTGGRASGISLFIQNNKPQFIYNTGVEKYVVNSNQIIPSGKSLIRFDFDFTDGKPSGSGVGTLYINNVKAGESKITRTVSSLFAHEGLNLGFDDLTPVSDTYKAPFPFTGKLNKVILDFQTKTAQ